MHIYLKKIVAVGKGMKSSVWKRMPFGPDSAVKEVSKNSIKP